MTPYMSALWMQTTAQANLCSSPPDKSSTFLSRRWLRSEQHQHPVRNLSSTRKKKIKHIVCDDVTQLFTDQLLRVCVVFPAQDGPHWPLQDERENFNVGLGQQTPTAKVKKQMNICVFTLTVFGIWSTYCGLTMARKSSSRILVK